MDTTHISYYVSADGPESDATWTVYRERYANRTDDQAIDGTQEKVSTHASEAEAEEEARRLQSLVVPPHTERVEYAPKKEPNARWWGTVQRRFIADDNGTARRMAVVHFGQPWQTEGIESYHNEVDLGRLSYASTILVEHDDFPSPEESAIALVQWVREEASGIFVHANGSDGYTYIVKVTETEDGELVAQATDAFKTEKPKR